jgi:sensor domain CHASE-containing protein
MPSSPILPPPEAPARPHILVAGIGGIRAVLGSLVPTLSSRPGSRWRAAAAGSVASIILSLSLAALAGYGFGVPGIAGWGNLTRAAAQCAAGLGLIGAGIFIVAWITSRSPGERTPRWLPIALALGTFTGSLVLYRALQEKQDEDAAQTVKFGAERAVNEITSHIESRIRVFAHMAQLWEFYGAPTQALFEDDSHDYLRRSPDIQSLEWVDRDYQTRWTVPAPRNGAKINPDLILDPRHRTAMDQAEHDHQPVVSRLVTLPGGDLGFVVYVPLIIDSRPDGFIAASFSAHSALRRYLPSHIADGESIELYDGGQLFYARDAAPENGRPDLIEQNIDLPGVTWRLMMWPAPVLAAQLNSPLPTVVLSAGLIFSFLLGGVCFFAQRSSRQAAETRRTNAALQAALDTVKTLEGLLPICSACKRVRDDTGYWSQIDTYIGKNTNASLSHGYCPECAAKAFQEFGFEVPEAVQAAVAAGNFEEPHHPAPVKV